MLAQKRTVSVRAEAKQQPKVNLARAAAAVITSVALFAAPVIAAAEVSNDTVRPSVCASNPTAKICLKGSFERSQK